MYERRMHHHEVRDAIDQIEMNATTAVVVGSRIALVTFSHDPYAPDPLYEREGNGVIWSLVPDHSNYSRTVVRRLLRERNDAVELSYRVKDNGFWFPRGETIDDLKVPTIEAAGVWVPDNAALADIGLANISEYRRLLVEFAKGVCDVHNRWRNDLVYCYRIALYDGWKDGQGLLQDAEFYYRQNPIRVLENGRYYDLQEMRDDVIEQLVLQGPVLIKRGTPRLPLIRSCVRQERHLHAVGR